MATPLSCCRCPSVGHPACPIPACGGRIRPRPKPSCGPWRSADLMPWQLSLLHSLWPCFNNNLPLGSVKQLITEMTRKRRVYCRNTKSRFARAVGTRLGVPIAVTGCVEGQIFSKRPRHEPTKPTEPLRVQSASMIGRSPNGGISQIGRNEVSRAAVCGTSYVLTHFSKTTPRRRVCSEASIAWRASHVRPLLFMP
jgi:hypothetical protein